MNKKYRSLVFLNLLLMLYSTSGIFSKLAARQTFLSFKFCLYYACIIALLGIYALGCQQVIKRLPLTTAFANKAVTIIWSMIWGAAVFHEKITPGKLFGALLVMLGVIIFVAADEEGANE